MITPISGATVDVDVAGLLDCAAAGAIVDWSPEDRTWWRRTVLVFVKTRNDALEQIEASCHAAAAGL